MLRKEFADLANEFEHRLHVISSELAAVDGPLEVCVLCLLQASSLTSVAQAQQQQVKEIQTRIPELKEMLAAEVTDAEKECNNANVEENDYTVFTTQDLQFELDLVVQSITKKLAFIDNQVG